LDAGHAEERRSDAVPMRKSWSVPSGPLDPAVVAAVEAELQRTTGERRARDANELAAMLDELGDLGVDEIAARAVGEPTALLDALSAERRVLPARFGARLTWVGATDAPLYVGLRDDDGALERVVLRLVTTRGPVTSTWLAARYAVDDTRATA